MAPAKVGAAVPMLSAMIWAFQLTPAMPRPLLVAAETVPETCVPCPYRSIGSPVPAVPSIPNTSST